jgi:hypothetical protein
MHAGAQFKDVCDAPVVSGCAMPLCKGFRDEFREGPPPSSVCAGCAVVAGVLFVIILLDGAREVSAEVWVGDPDAVVGVSAEFLG